VAHLVKVLVVPCQLDIPGIAKVTTVNTELTLSDEDFSFISPSAFTSSPPILQDLGIIGFTPNAISGVLTVNGVAPNGSGNVTVTATGIGAATTSALSSEVTRATTAEATKLIATNNLSDLTDINTAQINIGLGNVDNTADVAKPVSTAQAAYATSRAVAMSIVLGG
jgi:hypothetical protein